MKNDTTGEMDLTKNTDLSVKCKGKLFPKMIVSAIIVIVFSNV